MTFYMTLSSNNKTTEFPNNKISDFSIRLPERVSIPREHYTVGLVQISYINSVANLLIGNKDNRTIQMFLMDNPQYTVNLFVPVKTYEDIESFIETLNIMLELGEEDIKKLMSEAEHRHNIIIKKGAPFINYSKILDRVVFNQQNYKITISSHILSILGFSEEQTFKYSTPITAKFNPDLNTGSKNAFVYCNIIESGIVSNIKAPLLREFPLRLSHEDKDQSISRIFNYPFYMKLRLSEIDIIEIKVCDESGDPISFLKGPLTLTLEFRPV